MNISVNLETQVSCSWRGECRAPSTILLGMYRDVSRLTDNYVIRNIT